jgi:hypothetical protein
VPQARADLRRDRLPELGVEQAADHVRRGGGARRRQPQPIMKGPDAADQVGRFLLGQLAIGGVDLPLLARSIDEAVVDADVEVVLAERLGEERPEVGQVRAHERMEPRAQPGERRRRRQLFPVRLAPVGRFVEVARDRLQLVLLRDGDEGRDEVE